MLFDLKDGLLETEVTPQIIKSSCLTIYDKTIFDCLGYFASNSSFSRNTKLAILTLNVFLRDIKKSNSKNVSSNLI